MSAVYSLNTIDHRKTMWEDLTHLHNVLDEPWIAIGDYNTILSFGDIYNGNPVMEAETRDFSTFCKTRE